MGYKGSIIYPRGEKERAAGLAGQDESSWILVEFKELREHPSRKGHTRVRTGQGHRVENHQYAVG